ELLRGPRHEGHLPAPRGPAARKRQPDATRRPRDDRHLRLIHVVLTYTPLPFGAHASVASRARRPRPARIRSSGRRAVAHPGTPGSSGISGNLRGTQVALRHRRRFLMRFGLGLVALTCLAVIACDGGGGHAPPDRKACADGTAPAEPPPPAASS